MMMGEYGCLCAGAIIQFTSERVDGHIKETEDVQVIKTPK